MISLSDELMCLASGFPRDPWSSRGLMEGLAERARGLEAEPDIRPATELTAERLEAWTGHWAIEVDPPTLGKRWQCCPPEEIIWWTQAGCKILGCYPCRDKKPWRPVSWAEVDGVKP